MSARRRMGPPPRMRPVPPVRPEHAGGLPLWERVAFAVVLAIMVIFVVVLTISAARAHARRPAGPSGAGAAGAGAARTAPPPPQRPAQALQRGALQPHWDRRLAAALASVRRTQTGSLSVGVTDLSTGVTAVYGGRLGFRTASIVKVDILASLLLTHEREQTPLSDGDAELAAQMIETSSDDAASELWNQIGGAGGLAAADARLGLRHTTPGLGGYWGLTTTTAGDQLRLLRDLTQPDSPLEASSRDYELDLMRHVVAGQNWGVSAASSPGGVLTIKNGWLPDPSQWVINSIGEVDHDGQRLLLAVLSSGQPTEAAGIAQAQAAARAAADWVTATDSGRRGVSRG